VLERSCPECGLDTSSFSVAEIPGMIRANAAAWQRELGAPDAARRPRPDKWSPLEYGCHVRDVFRLYDYRLGLMLAEGDPQFPNWDQDETAVSDRSGVGGDQWSRTGRRSDGAAFTVETFGRYFVHDPVHHLYDVTGVRHTATS